MVLLIRACWDQWIPDEWIVEDKMKYCCTSRADKVKTLL